MWSIQATLLFLLVVQPFVSASSEKELKENLDLIGSGREYPRKLRTSSEQSADQYSQTRNLGDDDHQNSRIFWPTPYDRRSYSNVDDEQSEDHQSQTASSQYHQKRTHGHKTNSAYDYYVTSPYQRADYYRQPRVMSEGSYGYGSYPIAQEVPPMRYYKRIIREQQNEPDSEYSNYPSYNRYSVQNKIQSHPAPYGVYQRPTAQSQAMYQSNVNPAGIPNQEVLRRSWFGDFISSVQGAVQQLTRDLEQTKPILNLTSNDFLTMDPHRAALLTNIVCSAKLGAIAFPKTHVPNKNQIPVSLLYKEVNKTVPLESIVTLIEDPAFKSDKNITIYITGFDYVVDAVVPKMSKAYSCRNNENFLVIDVGKYVRNVSEWLALDTEKVGEMIAEVLNDNLPQYKGKSYHLIGDSVGAHVAVQVGHHYYEKSGTKIGRITLLNPSKPCTNELRPLRFGNALFSDSIHSSPHVAGSGLSQTDVSFYPKIDPTSTVNKNWISLILSVVDYYIETVYPGMENSFLAESVLPGIANRQSDDVSARIPMGYSTPTNARGFYVLDVNAEYPHGKNVDPTVKLECNDVKSADSN